MADDAGRAGTGGGAGAGRGGADHQVMVSVRGEATLEVEPELCEVTIVVEARDKDQRATLERLTKRNADTLAELKAYGDAVEKLETSGFTVYPDGDPKRRDEKVRAYAGSVRISVVIGDFSILGGLVGRMADGDMRSVQGPYWQLRRDSEVYRRVRTQAVGEAVTRAREYTAALGSAITGLVELADTGMSTSDGGRPMARTMMASYGAAPGGAGIAAPELDLEPVRQTVYASIEARFTASQPTDL